MTGPDPALMVTVWGGSAVVWVGLSVLVWRGWRLPKAGAVWVILGVALAARVAAVVLLPPTLSDDVWRYVFDGRTLAGGGNPYAASPAEVMAAREARGQAVPGWWSWINNPELVTIYQPTSQWVFAGLWAVSGGDHGGDGFTAAGFRLGFVGFDLLIVAWLLVQLRAWGRSLWWAVLYAWHPLAVIETAWSGHQDAIGIAALVGSLVLAGRIHPSEGRGGWIAAAGAGALLGLAAGVKPIVLPVALPLAWWVGRAPGGAGGWGRVGVAALSCVAALACLYVLFLMMEGGMGRMLETSRTFVDHWRFNGAIHPWVESALARGGVEDAKRAADLVMGGLLLAVLLLATWWCRGEGGLWRASAVYFFAMVLLSSTAHPWYLLWALAVLPAAWASGVPGILGGRGVVVAIWIASLTLPWSYVAWLNAGAGRGYTVGLGVWAAVWLPVFGALGWGAWVGVKATGGQVRPLHGDDGKG
ncbi:MAG: hypothetical protein AAF750_17275 [Planctomycetota bacterium]